MQSDAISALREAVKLFEEGKRTKRPIGFTLKHPPKLRTLTLAAEPGASVQKTVMGFYQCKIDGVTPGRLSRLHPTGLEAWAMLGRHVIDRADRSAQCAPVIVRISDPCEAHA